MALICGDALHLPLAGESVHCVVTSPPYWSLRRYPIPDLIWGGAEDCAHEWGESTSILTGNGPSSRTTLTGGMGIRESATTASQGTFCRRCNAWRGQLGLEPTVALYVEHMVMVMREVWRVLRADGTCWVNIGDSYASNGPRSNNNGMGASTMGWPGQRQDTLNKVAGMKLPPMEHGLKPKDLCMIPARVALALQADGWYVRSEITLCKVAPMPESVTDRPTSATEKLYLLSKGERYYWDLTAARAAWRADSAALGGAALTPETNPALNADEWTADFRGRHDASQNEITIAGTMAVETKRLKILKAIRFSVIIEGSERQFVMNLQGISGATENAPLLVALKRLAAGHFPVRATVVDAATSEGGAAHADSVNGVPLTAARARTENAHATGIATFLARVMVESLPAMVALKFDEARAPLYIRGTFRPAHSLHDTKNTEVSQGRNMLNYWLWRPDPFSERDIPPKIMCAADDPAAEQVKIKGRIFYVKPNPEYVDHYATFPRWLPERCILAGTSEKGCCAACGAQWRRVVDVSYSSEGAHGPRAAVKVSGVNGGGYGDAYPNLRKSSQTLGWQPACAHDAPVEPCRILDIFGGSGTVGEVAEALGRRWVCLDMSDGYIHKQAKKRTAQMGLFV